MTRDKWHRCYGEAWGNEIVPEAVSHPAKYSRALIRRIYQHCAEECWIEPGSVVLDPFGGVALGALEAMQLGCEWVGVELEERFCGMGRANIDLWNARYSALPRWGSATLLQGDSRRLRDVIAGASCCVSSPPYGCNNALGRSGNEERELAMPAADRIGRSGWGDQYGHHPAQLGNMPANQAVFECAISSPPYSAIAMDGGTSGLKAHRTGLTGGETSFAPYGSAPGQLGRMPEGSADACVSSPPFSVEQPCASQSRSKKDYHAFTRGSGTKLDKQMQSDGNLAAMPQGEVSQVVSSPPYEAQPGHGGTSGRFEELALGKGLHSPEYGGSNGQIATRAGGDTFWAASRTILEQVFATLKPGGHACFVVKAFCRNGQIVDFPGQWARLCEAVGFELLHEHHAMLTEDRGTQMNLDGDAETKTVARKSFFRRLHEAKRPHLAIDFEVVLCFVKPCLPCL